MQPLPLPSAVASNNPPPAATVLATCAAAGAVLSVLFALIPVLGLAASMLILGFITVLAIWTRRKRALIGTGIAFLAVIISSISTFLATSAILQSRDDANAKLAQMQTQLQVLRAQATSASDQSTLGDLIKLFDTNNDLTKDQANTLGKLAEWFLKSATSSPTPDPKRK